MLSSAAYWAFSVSKCGRCFSGLKQSTSMENCNLAVLPSDIRLMPKSLKGMCVLAASMGVAKDEPCANCYCSLCSGIAEF